MLKFFSDLGSKRVEEMKLKSNEGKELKPGTRVYAKVLKSNGNKYLLSLNGNSILAKSERELEIGQLVKLRIEKITDKNELIVRLDEDIKENKETVNKSFNGNNLLAIKKEILKLSIEEKIYLSNVEVEELVEGLDKFHKRGKEITADLIKALIVMKKGKIGSEDIFEGLRRYYSNEPANEMSIKNIYEDIKDEIKYLSKNEDIFAKGVNAVNDINENQGFLAFLFGIKEFAKPISIQMKKEGIGRKFSKESINIVIKFELESLGKFDVNINIWKKRLNLSFMFYQEVDKSRFVNLKELEKNMEKLGYIVEEIHIGRKAEEKVGEIGNINFKV